MSRPVAEVVIDVFNEWFLKEHGMLPEQAIERIAELEADRDDQAVKNYEQAKRITELEAESKRLKLKVKRKEIVLKGTQIKIAELEERVDFYAEGICLKQAQLIEELQERIEELDDGGTYWKALEKPE